MACFMEMEPCSSQMAVNMKQSGTMELQSRYIKFYRKGDKSHCLVTISFNSLRPG